MAPQAAILDKVNTNKMTFLATESSIQNVVLQRNMGCSKLKSAFDHAQNAQIQIILCMQSLIWAFVLHWYIL